MWVNNLARCTKTWYQQKDSVTSTWNFMEILPHEPSDRATRGLLCLCAWTCTSGGQNRMSVSSSVARALFPWDRVSRGTWASLLQLGELASQLLGSLPQKSRDTGTSGHSWISPRDSRDLNSGPPSCTWKAIANGARLPSPKGNSLLHMEGHDPRSRPPSPRGSSSVPWALFPCSLSWQVEGGVTAVIITGHRGTDPALSSSLRSSGSWIFRQTGSKK